MFYFEGGEKWGIGWLKRSLGYKEQEAAVKGLWALALFYLIL
jgi:hypothetical protein